MEKQQTGPVRRSRLGSGQRSAQAGMTLIEAVIALAVLFIVSTGLMGLGVVAMVTTENQGHLATRTAEYAQDKMEQLMSLQYGDGCDDTPGSCVTGSDTINADCVQYLVAADCSTGEAGLTPGGDLNFTSPDESFVDYLDATGNPLGGGLAAPAGWFYVRVWRVDDITTDETLPDNIKRITVSCMTRATLTGKSGLRLASTFTTLKSHPF